MQGKFPSKLAIYKANQSWGKKAPNKYVIALSLQIDFEVINLGETKPKIT